MQVEQDLNQMWNKPRLKSSKVTTFNTFNLNLLSLRPQRQRSTQTRWRSTRKTTSPRDLQGKWSPRWVCRISSTTLGEMKKNYYETSFPPSCDKRSWRRTQTWRTSTSLKPRWTSKGEPLCLGFNERHTYIYVLDLILSRAWESLPEYGVSLFVVKFHGEKKEELLVSQFIKLGWNWRQCW